MTISSAVYSLLIGPLELLFEFIFSFAQQLTGNQGLSIIVLSLVMNLLLLPLYKQADRIQEEERETEKRLSHWVKHIKKAFTGDERYMVLQTYYRQNNYRPTDVLRGMTSLLLEVPFFIAAYNMLSSLQLLQGTSFGPIADLGTPDGMLTLGGLTINLLPVLMTLINLVSSAIYTRGLPFKSKLQLYGMALLFLVLLYSSPSGLVLYWTLNNLFSLVKNIATEILKVHPAGSSGVKKALRKYEKQIAAVCSAVGILGVIAWQIHPLGGWLKYMALLALCLMLQLPLLLRFLRKRRPGKPLCILSEKQEKQIFFLGTAVLAALTGLLIPSTLIGGSPSEFVNHYLLVNPVMYVAAALLVSAGTCMIWMNVFYSLSGTRAKKLMNLGLWLLIGVAVVDYMFFGKGYGKMSRFMIFDDMNRITNREVQYNLLAIAGIMAVMAFIWAKRKAAARMIYLTALLAMVVMSAMNLSRIYSTSRETIQGIRENNQQEITIPLSKTGKNVLVIMLDKAIGVDYSYIFEEIPGLKEQYQGFVHYPYTISYGVCTNPGAPGIFGGYEYIPQEMNKNLDQTLAQKHDEALKVLPRLFADAGFASTTIDAPLAGYDVIPPYEVFKEEEGVNAFFTSGRFADPSEEAAGLTEIQNLDALMRRNLSCYSLFKITPTLLQKYIYAGGSYNDADQLYADQLQNMPRTAAGQIWESASRATGFNPSFMEALKIMKAFPEITRFQESGDTYMAFASSITHSPQILQVPEYVPRYVVDNTQYDADHPERFILNGHEMNVSQPKEMAQHHCGVAGAMVLGEWLDYLKENDVYDNTRIIVVSDHGADVDYFPDLWLGEQKLNTALEYNALLMVKDFNSREEFRTDTTFMTNADVPVIAAEGLIENPRNPFTGNPLTMDYKQGPQYLIARGEWEIYLNHSAQYLPSCWYTLDGDMFQSESWKLGDVSGTLPNP